MINKPNLEVLTPGLVCPSLKELLLSDQARTDMVFPPRGRVQKNAQKTAEFNVQLALARNARLS